MWKKLKGLLIKSMKHNSFINFLASLTFMMFATACKVNVLFSFAFVFIASLIKELYDLYKYGDDYKPEAIIDFLVRVLTAAVFAIIIIVYMVKVV